MPAILPGPVCQFFGYLSIDEGTLARYCSAPLGPANGAAVKPKFDKAKAAQSAYDNAYDTYPEALKAAKAAAFQTTRCAHYVRLAIAAGGIQVQPPNTAAAKDFGPKLMAVGFQQIKAGAGDPGQDYNPEPGDVIVYGAIDGDAYGHMEIYDGDDWESDFTQKSIWPNNSNPAWKKVSFAIYRFPN